MSARVLVVDDGEMAEMVADYLVGKRYVAECYVGGKAAIAALKKKSFDAIITDLRMDQVDGMDVLAASLADDPSRPVIIMTAYGSIDGAIDAVRAGASHYLMKPFKMDEAALYLERALADRGLRRENERLRRVADERLSFRNLIGGSEVMQHLYDLLERVSAT